MQTDVGYVPVGLGGPLRRRQALGARHPEEQGGRAGRGGQHLFTDMLPNERDPPRLHRELERVARQRARRGEDDAIELSPRDRRHLGRGPSIRPSRGPSDTTASSMTVRPAARRKAVHSIWRNARTWLGSRRRSTSVMNAAELGIVVAEDVLDEERAAGPQDAGDLPEGGQELGEMVGGDATRDGAEARHP